MKKLLLILLCLSLFRCTSEESGDVFEEDTPIPQTTDKFQKFYYETGELQFQGNYDRNEIRQGSWREYFKNGQIKAEGSLLDGMEIGLWKFYYENGQIEREVDISDGNNGYVKRYFKNGKLSFEGGMKDGVDDGLCKTYYENGQLKAEGNIKNKASVGLWKVYNQDGKLIMEKIY
jgi:uncharacterized protein